MTKPQTLNEVRELEESGFGKFYPRHGLSLLYWFANDCLYFDDNKKMRCRYDPEEGVFGFQLFENRYDKNSVKLLPDGSFKYYEVGNLRRPGADKLPNYVRGDYTQNPQHSESKKDRIVVSVEDKCFDRVYITEHSGQAGLNKKTTYCISRSLIMMIRDLTLDRFLLKSGYLRLQDDSDQSSSEDDDDDDNICDDDDNDDGDDDDDADD